MTLRLSLAFALSIATAWAAALLLAQAPIDPADIAINQKVLAPAIGAVVFVALAGWAVGH